ncbi:MAG: hypothetical protein U5L08_06435 [Xanthomonadales bacterium]|nr:hypothetical protein [Xanthomonadales bacterium]
MQGIPFRREAQGRARAQAQTPSPRGRRPLARGRRRAAPVQAGAQNKPASFIRDSEIEETIRAYATPIFQAAGLNPERIDVYLIADDTLNAFVAGGMNMFLHTGLLQRARRPPR